MQPQLVHGYFGQSTSSICHQSSGVQSAAHFNHFRLPAVLIRCFNKCFRILQVVYFPHLSLNLRPSHISFVLKNANPDHLPTVQDWTAANSAFISPSIYYFSLLHQTGLNISQKALVPFVSNYSPTLDLKFLSTTMIIIFHKNVLLKHNYSTIADQWHQTVE